MNTVGDVADRDIADPGAGVEGMPHLAADFTVKFADAVGRARGFQRQNGHAERFGLIVGVDAAEAHEVFGFHLHRGGKPVERVVHQAGAEAVVAGFDGRVRGKMAFLAGFGEGIGEFLAFVKSFPNQFERQEGGVPFVQMEQRRPEAKGAEKADTANAQQDFLHDAGGAVPTVNAQGQIAVVLFVFGQVGVEQINRAAADIGAPCLVVDHRGADFDLAHDGFPFGV